MQRGWILRNAVFTISSSAGAFLLAAYLDRARPGRLKLFQSRKREAEHTILSVVAMNTVALAAVYLVGKRGHLVRQWENVLGGKHHANISSAFFHVGFAHFALNMAGLYSIGKIAHQKMGREQFGAFFISAAAISSFGSLLVRYARSCYIPSVGASGVIFGLLGSLLHERGIGISLVFLPGVQIPISTAIAIFACFDGFALIRGWRFMDHSAHLAGLLFGCFYAKYGDRIWGKARAVAGIKRN